MSRTPATKPIEERIAAVNTLATALLAQSESLSREVSSISANMASVEDSNGEPDEIIVRVRKLCVVMDKGVEVIAILNESIKGIISTQIRLTTHQPWTPAAPVTKPPASSPAATRPASSKPASSKPSTPSTTQPKVETPKKKVEVAPKMSLNDADDDGL